MFRTAWNTDGKILEPPGSPSARTGRPSRDTIVGAIELVMRFPDATDRACPGCGSKRPIVLLSRRPVPGTVAFEPKVASWVVGHDHAARSAGCSFFGREHGAGPRAPVGSRHDPSIAAYNGPRESTRLAIVHVAPERTFLARRARYARARCSARYGPVRHGPSGPIVQRCGRPDAADGRCPP